MSQYVEESHRSFLSGSTLGRYVRVKLSGSTANTVIVAGAADAAVGVTRNAVLTSGDPVDVILSAHDGTIPMVASGAITVNATVYGDAAGKVTSTANGLPVGVALTSASADGDIIEVGRATGLSSGKLFTAVAAATAVTNTVTQTAFDQAFTIPANVLAAGDRIRVFAQGIATATNSTDTLTVTLRIGTTDVLVSAAVDVANNDIFVISGDIVIRTAGAGGTFVAAGLTNVGVPATATTRAAFKASTAIDTTATQSVNVTATWSVANAGNSCRLDILNVERLPA